MNTKIKNIVGCVVMAVCIFGFAVLCLVLPKPEFLDSERREPAKFPELSIEAVMKDGADYADSFMKKFDDKYTPDNFPFRDFFRSLKAFVKTNFFGFKDKDGVYVVDGYAAEMQEKIDAGILLAQQRLKEKCKKEDGELVIMRDGKVTHIKADEIE